MTAKLSLVRWIATIFAFVTLVGGYGAHQFFTARGELPAYVERIYGTNLAVGWALLILAVALTLIREPEDGGG
jgi:hypothetical protein